MVRKREQGSITTIINFMQLKSPTSVSGELNKYWYSISRDSTPG